MTKLLMIDLRPSVPCPIPSFDPGEVPLKVQLSMGHVVGDLWNAVSVALEDDKEVPMGLVDLIQTVPFIMASLSLVNLLRSFNCDCEYLPLIVHYHGRRLEGEYFALNALRVVDAAIDIDQSSIGFYDPEYRQAEDVSKLVLNEAALGDAPLTFLDEIGRFAVSDKLAQAITDAGLIGIKLVKPEEFSS